MTINLVLLLVLLFVGLLVIGWSIPGMTVNPITRGTLFQFAFGIVLVALSFIFHFPVSL